MSIDTKAKEHNLNVIAEMVQANPNTVIAFDSMRLKGEPGISLLSSVNDLLASTYACKRLGTVYTVCEYGMGTWLLIPITCAKSLIPGFDTESKRF